MVMKPHEALILLAMAATACTRAGYIEPIDHVNPLVATCNTPEVNFWGELDGPPHANSRCSPGAFTPFGMASIGPVTRHHGDTPPGYDTHDTLISGFAFMRTSGSGWYSEFGNMLTMPANGPLEVSHGLDDGSIKGFSSRFSKETEQASAGYYSVILDDYGILTECTASPHGGVLRFTYPAADTSRFLCDLAFRITGSSDHQEIHILDDHNFEGHLRYTPATGGWGNGDAHVCYDLYFHAQVDKPLKDYGFWSADIPEGFVRKDREVNTPEYMQILSDSGIIRGRDGFEGDCIGFFSEFPTTEGEKVELKVAFSYVDLEGARNNFKAELEGRSFDDIHAGARDLWKEKLGKIKISGGSEDQQDIFYTALYHSMIDPRIFTDVDGRFMGGDGKPHVAEGYTRRTIFSGWDVFRSQMPLHTIISPDMVQDLIKGQIALAEESGKGYYDRWEMLNAYTGCMIGNPTISVIADAWQKGIRGFDLDKALEYSINSSDQAWGDRTWHDAYCVSDALELSYFDWCTYYLAREAGDNDVADRFLKQSERWKEYFNEDVNWFLPTDKETGKFKEPDEGWTKRLFFGTCECNIIQQGWFVPHDFGTLTDMLGGRDSTVARLDAFFGNASWGFGWNDFYCHSNEPVHWAPFLFNKLGEPWKTQGWCRTILDKCYFNDSEGLVGNEDEGQMSAWYILTASGFHPSCPGDGRMEITSPIFDRVAFKLDPRFHKGRKFTVVAHDASPENIYVQKAQLNGKPLNQSWFYFSAIVEGGKLELWMGPEPNKNITE